jgi:hypothetical protein
MTTGLPTHRVSILAKEKKREKNDYSHRAPYQAHRPNLIPPQTPKPPNQV